MAAHGGVTIEAVGIGSDAREEVAEGLVAAQIGRAYDNGGPDRSEHVEADVEGSSDGADLRRAIESGADFVLIDGRAEVLELLKNLRKMRGHPLRGAAAAVAGDADGSRGAEAG